MTRDMHEDSEAGSEAGAELGGGLLPSPLDHLLGYRMRRASMTMMADLLGALKPLGLSAGEASFLILVGANPGCRQTDIGRTLDIQRANLTPLVTRMKARGFISDAPIDGRSRSITLTDEGMALRDAALAKVQQSSGKFSARLALDDATLIAALKAIEA